MNEKAEHSDFLPWTLDIPCWILGVQKENEEDWPGSNQGNMYLQVVAQDRRFVNQAQRTFGEHDVN